MLAHKVLKKIRQLPYCVRYAHQLNYALTDALSFKRLGGLKYEALSIILVVFCGPVDRCCLYRFGGGTGKGKNKY